MSGRQAAGNGSGAGTGDGGSGGPTPTPTPGSLAGAATVLERRYRRLLILLPRAYRADRGEEMLTVLMDGAPEQQRWPKIGEAFSLATHGIKVRSGLGAAAVQPRAARPLMRAVALLGTLYLSFLSGVGLLIGQRWNWGIYQSDINHCDLDGHHHPSTEVVLVQVAGLLLGLIAYTALLLGRRRVAQAAGWVLLVPAATQITGAYTALAAAPALIVAAALVLTARRPTAPAPHRWRGLAALAAVAALDAVLGWYGQGIHNRPAAIAPLAAVAVAVAAVGALRAWRRAEWVVAAAIIGGMAGAQRALDANHYPSWQGGFDSWLRLILLGEAVLVLIALYAIVRQRRSVVGDGTGEAA